MKTDKKLINFVAPVRLLAEFDEAIAGKYNSRTDAILDLMRRYVQERIT